MKSDTGHTRHGVVLIDKSVGISSAACVGRLRKRLNRAKTGHAGTLDPFATGLLPMCFGRATKLIERIRTGVKTYEAQLLLGVLTDTQDITGNVIETVSVNPVDMETARTIANTMVGKQMQIPPMYSAKKIKGKRLYQLARENIVVERKPSEITVYKFEILQVQDAVIRFTVDCSEGTYVRSLGVEFAKKLGYPGTLEKLRRTKVGRFSIDQAFDDTKLMDDSFDVWEHVIPTERITESLDRAVIANTSESKFRNGAFMSAGDFTVFPEELFKDKELNVFSEKGLFLGLGRITGISENGDWTLKTERLIDI